MQYTPVDTHGRTTTKRSKSAERLIHSDRSEAPSVARSRSSERMLSQSSHHTHGRLPRSEPRQAHHVSSRSPDTQVAPTKSDGCDRSLSRRSHRSPERKLERKKSSEKLSRMEP
jgi:hypothetical protein